ncbi:MAG: hypothetical protein OHK0039_02150 [Bacteroidia bacterium]
MSHRPHFSLSHRRNRWIFLGLLTLCLDALLGANPYFAESFYSQGLFLLFRTVWDYTLGWSPLPWVYVLALVLAGFCLYACRAAVRAVRRGQRNVRQQAGHMLLNLLAAVGGIITLFFWLWGFNYNRQPVEHRLGLHLPDAGERLLAAEWRWAVAEATAARAVFDTSAQALMVPPYPARLEDTLRAGLEAVLADMGYPTAGRVRGRVVYPPGTLMQLGASGIYIPFVAEGHIDAGLHPLSVPYTLAHELAHGYGFGDEGTCSFLAYLACMRTAQPAIHYAAALSYWREVAVQYRQTIGDSLYLTERATLPPGMIADIDSVNACLHRYPGFFPRFSQDAYDLYLQSQGIDEGSLNYSRVIVLLRAWRQRDSTASVVTLPQ